MQAEALIKTADFTLAKRDSIKNDYQNPRKGWVTKNYFSYFLSETYVVGTQKNRLNETVLLSTQNTCLNRWVRK